MNIFKKLSDIKGVSLLEILITLAIAGILTTAVFKTYLTQHENYMTQSNITDIQQNGRIVIDELTRHIRIAGNNLPPTLDAIVASDANPDTITLIFRIGNCKTYLNQATPIGSSQLRCGSDVSCFHDNTWAYIHEPDSNWGEWFFINNIDSGNRYLTNTSLTLDNFYNANSSVIPLQELKYFIDNTTDPDKPLMMIQIHGDIPRALAENISDFQLRYRLKNGLVVDEPPLVGDIEIVNISITATSNDNNGGSNARIFASSVNVRNLN